MAILNTADWDKIKINVDDLTASPMTKTADILKKAFPGFEFGFPVPEEIDEWTQKHWAILHPQDWPEFQEWNKRTPGVYGLKEKDGGLFFLSHLVVYRPTDFDIKVRRAEMEAKEAHYASRVRRDGEDAPHAKGISFEGGGEEGRVTILKKPGRPRKS